MSGFDEAMRKHAAASNVQSAEQDAQYRAAEAAVPRISELLREFAERLAISGIEALPVKIGSTYKRGWVGGKQIPVMSPPGYVLDRTVGFDRVSVGLVLVTHDGKLFRKTRDDSGSIVQITAENILARKVYCGGPVEVGPNGVVAVKTGYDPDIWQSLEDNIAGFAFNLIKSPRGRE
jgi:hypothetical protein